jgi:hypothetical protein
MIATHQVLADNPNLLTYRVTLKEEAGEDFTTVFDCYAESDDHAQEQAENAYPACEIINTTPFSF